MPSAAWRRTTSHATAGAATLRCLREDLALPLPRAGTPLDEITHPLLAKAAERFADDQAPQERIATIDDQVLFKVKVQMPGRSGGGTGAGTAAPRIPGRAGR